MTRFYIRYSVFILCPMHMSGTLCAFSVPHVYVRYVVFVPNTLLSCYVSGTCAPFVYSLASFLRSVPLVFATDMCCPWQVSSILVF